VKVQRVPLSPLSPRAQAKPTAVRPQSSGSALLTIPKWDIIGERPLYVTLGLRVHAGAIRARDYTAAVILRVGLHAGWPAGV
jgi:hypothetical protein